VDAAPNPLANVALRYRVLMDRPAPARAVLLWLESAALAWLTLWIPSLLGANGSQHGIFALLLLALCLHHRFDRLLAEHRERIMARGTRPATAHRIAATSILAMFLGVITAYGSTVALWSLSRVETTFGFVVQAAGVARGDLLARQFGDPSSLVAHNVRVLIAVVFLCGIWRAYAAVLVLGWNACVWVVALGILATRTVLDPPGMAMALGGVMPHLVLELCAYIAAALGGIFASRGVTRHRADSALQTEILKNAAALIFMGLVLVILAGVVEATLPAWVFARLS